MTPQKKNFRLYDRLRIAGTLSPLDGQKGINLGRSVENVVDFYIVELNTPTKTHAAVALPEHNLELAE